MTEERTNRAGKVDDRSEGPEIDDGNIYLVVVKDLIEANHRKQYEEHYWQEFRRLGEALSEYDQGHKATDIPDHDPIIQEFISIWKAYEGGDYQKYAANAITEAAKRRLYMYCDIKKTGYDKSQPVRLIGRCAQKRIYVNGYAWDYKSLNGNHRLIASYFCDLQTIPAVLVSK